MKLDLYLLYKNQLQKDKELNVKPKILKLNEEFIGSTYMIQV